MFKKIATNTLSQIFSKVITAIISIFLIWMLTKYLSPEMYWQYNKVYNYLSIFTFLADLWLYTISIREISKDQSKAEKIIWSIMTLRFILWVFIIFFAVWIAFLLPWYDSNLMIISIIITAFFSLFSLLNSSVLSLMQAFMKMEFSLVSLVLWKIVNLIVIWFIIFYIFPKAETSDYFLPFIWIMLSWLVWIMINYFLNYYYAKKIVKIKFLFDFEYINYLFKTSLPYGIALFLSVVYFKVDIILLSLLEPKEVSDISVAFYSLPMKIVEVLMVVWVFFLNSVLPTLSLYFKENLSEKISELLKFCFRFLFWFSVFIVLFWILFRENIIKIIATSEYLEKTNHIYNSWDAFIIVFFVILFYFVSAIFNYIFIASKNESILLKINIFITIFNIIWNIILIPKYSFIWSWIVTLLSQILLFILWYIYTRNIVKFKIEFVYIFYCLLSWILLYFLWDFMLKNYSFWVILDVFIYGIIVWILQLIVLVWLNYKRNNKTKIFVIENFR